MTRMGRLPQPQAQLDSEQRGPAGAEKRIFILSPQFTSQIGHSSSHGGSCEWKHEARQMQAASLITLFFFSRQSTSPTPDLKPSHPRHHLSRYPFLGIPITLDACATLLNSTFTTVSLIHTDEQSIKIKQTISPLIPGP